MVNYCNNCITPYTPEQARDKQRSWVCTNQLLINKMILDELKHHCRNLLIIWFGYKKTFDSAPHTWILQALELAHVPSKITNAINELMSTLATKLHLNFTDIGVIKYLTGVLQRDYMALVMFILSLSPVSFLLSKLPG